MSVQNRNCASSPGSPGHTPTQSDASLAGSAIAAQRQGEPPTSCDFKASSPRQVIRGETSFLPVCIDYVSFSIPNGQVPDIVNEAMQFLGVPEATDRKRGLFGYLSSVDLGGYGVIAYGGENQRGTVLVSINGEGCRRIAHFSQLREWAEPLGARVTRLDIAADDHDGKALDVGKAIEAWRAGAFTLGGRPPKARAIDDLGSGGGKTLYIGSREGGKLCRVYEKGKQLGDRKSKWVRGEVELHAKDRVIPWEAISLPAPYLAGTFPYFRFLSLVAERIRTVKRATEISIKAVAAWVRNAAGKSLNVLLQHHEGDYGALVESLRRDGVPRRLAGWWGAEERLRGAT